MQQDFLRRLVDAEELLRLFQKQPSVQDGPNEFNLQQGGVVFEDVTFTYNDKKNIVNDLSFHAEPGQTIALIGETGAGKSTILKLLFRLYDVNEGSIKIDGQDVRDVTLGSLREHIGVVPQDPSLFNDTIMANVRFARLDATDEEVMEACKSACIHDKILTFTDGYDSKVGERGQKLSGGELQRVAIARAILKNPRIILLDEATSSVDTETEANIQQALKKLVTGRTTFVVAHRLSTVTDADRILVIKDGTILEQGHPKELFKSRGKYYSLCSKQMGILDASEDHGSSEGSESRGASSSASKKSLAGTRTPSRDTGDQRTTNETGTSDKKSTDELSEERISRTGQSSQPQSDKSASRGSSDNDGAMTGNKTPIDQTASKQSSSGNTSRKMSIGGEDERRKSASSGPASKKSSSGNTSRKMSLSTSVKGKKLPGSDESGKGSPTEGNPETSSPSENTKKSQNLPLEQSAYQSQSNDLKGAPPSQKREGYPATESSTKKTVDGDDTQKTKKADQQQKTGIPTSRKKRAFRAEAPEFVPRSQQRFSSSRDESQSSYTGSQEEATKHHHHPHRHRSSHSGEHHHFRNRHREESADTTQTSQKDSKEEKHHHFRNRRHQAKSEPNQDASKSQADGAADDNETLETADAILMPPPPSRRVSAPSDPLMANVSKARGRNRRVSRRGSNSTTQTLNESGDWSNASGIPVAVPAAPYPSPIGGPPPSHELLSTSTGASQLGRSFK